MGGRMEAAGRGHRLLESYLAEKRVKGVLGAWNDEMIIDKDGEELEVLEIVKWKIVFNSRPEPVGDGEED